MPVELVVFLVGVGSAVLAGFGTWWAFAVPAINRAATNTAAAFVTMSPHQFAEYQRLYLRRRDAA